MKFRFASILATLFVFPLLLIGTGAQHQLMATTMPNMMHSFSKVDNCLSTCGSRLQPIATAINQREVQVENEPKPEAGEPYFIQFLKFAPLLGLISSAYFLAYLRWRPPDLFRLYAVYRI